MNYGVGLLLKEMDRESSRVQQEFGRDGEHRNLEDFSGALRTFENLEGILGRDSSLSPVEASVVGAFYSALSFRILDTSSVADAKKFAIAKKVMDRASYLTLDVNPIVHMAQYRSEHKLAQFSSKIGTRLRTIKRKYEALLGYLFSSNNFVNYIIDIGPIFRVMHFPIGEKDFLSMANWTILYNAKLVYEFARLAAFEISAFRSAMYFTEGDYGRGLMHLGVDVGIPLSRYFYRRRRIEEILGDYQMPKIAPTRMNNQGTST